MIYTTNIPANDSAMAHTESVVEIIYEASYWGGVRVNHISLIKYKNIPRLKVWVTFDAEKSKGKPRTKEFVVHDSVWNEAIEILKLPNSNIDVVTPVNLKRDVTSNLKIYTGSRNNKKIYRNTINAASLIQYLTNTANNHTDILNE